MNLNLILVIGNLIQWRLVTVSNGDYEPNGEIEQILLCDSPKSWFGADMSQDPEYGNGYIP